MTALSSLVGSAGGFTYQSGLTYPTFFSTPPGAIATINFNNPTLMLFRFVPLANMVVDGFLLDFSTATSAEIKFAIYDASGNKITDEEFTNTTEGQVITDLSPSVTLQKGHLYAIGVYQSSPRVKGREGTEADRKYWPRLSGTEADLETYALNLKNTYATLPATVDYSTAQNEPFIPYVELRTA